MGEKASFHVVTESEARKWERTHSDPDTLRILVATDNHAGFMERDPVRGNDSFAALEEIFIRAKKYNSDLVLLGGDLFHDNKPSRKALHSVIGIMRRNCLSDEAVSFEVISDQQENFKSGFGTVNYMDPHYSVGLPVFSIHGNHDDPAREGTMDPLSAMDLLSVNNLVNYFGKCEETSNIEVNPILLRKGNLRVALYGLGNIRDERLHRMWQQRKVKFLAHTDGPTAFFNIFVLHQNRDRKGRGPKNCVLESMIPEWMDLVIWGHEHECSIHPIEAAYGTNDLRIIQPGSSVATSLVEGEAVPKMIGMLEITPSKEDGRAIQYRLSAIPLKNVRPFVLKEVDMSALAREHDLDPSDPQIEEKMSDVLAQQVEEMIEEARANNPEPRPFEGQQILMQNFHQVLVRLKVDHTGYPTLNNHRFGARFVGQVANPTDILLFHKRKRAEDGRGERGAAGKASQRERGLLSQKDLLQGDDDDRTEIRVEDLVRAQLEASDRQPHLLDALEMNLALDDFVNKNSTQAIADAVQDTLDSNHKELISKLPGHDVTEEAITEAAAELREQQHRRAEAKLKAAQDKGGDKGDEGRGSSSLLLGGGGKGKAKAAATKKAVGGKKKGGRAEDEDESEGEESEEGGGEMDVSESEEERASSSISRSKASSKASSDKAASKKKPSKPSAAASKPVSKRRPVADDDDDDDDDIVEVIDDDDDDDDDDEGPKRRKAPAASSSRAAKPARAATKTKKYAADFSDGDDLSEDDDEYQDDEDDDDDDDEEDDESVGRGRKGGKKKPAAAKAGSRKPAASGANKGAAAKKGAAAGGKGRGGAAAAKKAAPVLSQSSKAPSTANTRPLPWSTGGSQRSTMAAPRKRPAPAPTREVTVLDDDDDDDEEEEEDVGPSKKRSKPAAAVARRRGDDDDDDEFDTSMLSSRDF